MCAKAFHALDPLLHPMPDLLHQETEYVQRLFELLDQSIEPPLSVSINGNWGTGKTSLMKSLQEKFETQENPYPVIWFNPWEYERVEDIVYCFFLELSRFAQGKLDGMKEELGIFGLTLLTSGVDLTARLLTGNKLSFKEISFIEEKMRETLKDRYKKDNPIEILKKDFASLTSKITKKFRDHP